VPQREDALGLPSIAAISPSSSGSPALQRHTPPSPNSRNTTVTMSGVVPNLLRGTML
jgi:hypothetical protein